MNKHMLYRVMSKPSTLTAQNILTKPSHRQQVLRSFSSRFSSCAAINAFPSFATSLVTAVGFIGSFMFLPTMFPSSTVDPDTSTHATKQHQSWASHPNFFDDPICPHYSGYTKNTNCNFEKAFTWSQRLASQLFCMCCFWCFPNSGFCMALILRTYSINSYVMYLSDIISFVWRLCDTLMYHLSTSFNMFQAVPLGHLHDLQKLKGSKQCRASEAGEASDASPVLWMGLR